MKRTSYLPAFCIAALSAVIAWVHLYLQNAHVLYQFQEQQLFLSGCEFFLQTLHKAGGPFTWAGLYLQQYLYHPAVGALLLILIWTAGYLASAFAFKLKGGLSALAILPVAGLMSTLLCTGYWIYVLKVPEYAFTPTLMYLTAMGLALLVRKIHRAWIWQTIICLAFLLYGLYWVKAAVVPEGLRPAFHFTFYSILILPVLSFSGKWTDKLFDRQMILSICIDAALVLGLAAFVWFYSDANTYRSDAYRTEMLMAKAVEEGRWQDAIDEAEAIETKTASSKATRQIWLMRMISLMNLGRIGDELYAYHNNTVLPEATTGVTVHMIETGGPLLYFMNGYTHYAYRWSIENMVEYGPSPSRLRLLTMCAIVNREDRLAKKYLDLLSQTKFYGAWVEEQYKILKNKSLLSTSEPYRLSSKFQSKLTNAIDTDGGLCEVFLAVTNSCRKNVTDPELSELCLNYAMIQMKADDFWYQFMNYLDLHPGLKLPLYYQQAAILFSVMVPESVPEEIDMQSLGIDTTMASSFENLMSELRSKSENKNTPAIALARRSFPDFGHSYFWFYLFCRNNEIY